MTTIPAFQSPIAIADHLKISPEFLGTILEFLCKTGLVTCKDHCYKIGENRIHLNKGSLFLPQHHWRLQDTEDAGKTQ